MAKPSHPEAGDAPPVFTPEARPTAAQLRLATDVEGRIRSRAGLPFGQITCASRDESYDVLNEIIDKIEAAADITLSDLSYRAAAVTDSAESGVLVFEVSGNASDAFEDDEGPRQTRPWGELEPW